MMPVTGTRETRTKPVTTVPTTAPTVPMPDSRPTTVPVSAMLDRRSLVTAGVTAESRAPGTKSDSPAASRSIDPSADSAASRTRNGVAATVTPDTISNGPISRRAGTRSASRPPHHDPVAIAVSATPMTMVLVSSVSPRYGARSRSATSSTTRTAAEDPKTSAAAATGPSVGGAGCCSVPGTPSVIRRS